VTANRSIKIETVIICEGIYSGVRCNRCWIRTFRLSMTRRIIRISFINISCRFSRRYTCYPVSINICRYDLCISIRICDHHIYIRQIGFVISSAEYIIGSIGILRSVSVGICIKMSANGCFIVIAIIAGIIILTSDYSNYRRIISLCLFRMSWKVSVNNISRGFSRRHIGRPVTISICKDRLCRSIGIRNHYINIRQVGLIVCRTWNIICSVFIL